MGKVTKALAWSAAEQFGVKAISLLTQIVLARLLLPEEFGVLAILLVVVNVADVIAQSGFGQAIIQRTNADEVTFSTAFWLSMLIAAAIYALVFVLSPAIASFYGNGGIELFLKVVSLKLFLDSANSIQRSILQRRMDFRALFRASFAATLLAGAGGIALALAGTGIWALIAQVMLNSLLACAAMALQLRWLPRAAFDAGEAGALFRFGWKMAVTGVLHTLYSGVSELVVGKACSTEGLGYYSQGRKYPIAVIGAVNNALCNVLFPAFAELKHDLGALRGMASKGLVMGTCVIAPAVTLLIVSAEPLVAIVLSERWLPSVPVFQVTCAPYLVILLQVVNLRAYMALGRSDVYMAVHLVKFATGLPAILAVAVATRDIYCVAGATAAIDLTCILLVDIAPAGRLYGFARLEQLRLLAPTYAACAFAAVPAALLNLAPLGYAATLALQAAAFAACYLLLARLMRIDAVFSAISMARGMLPGRRAAR